MDIHIPKPVSDIIHTLEIHGFEAYAVGGCVRDSILGKTPADWDITTSAKPEQIKSFFPRTIDTGIKHGTVTVMIYKTGYEVTTFRIDGFYEDHRRPNNVTFTDSLREDLMRRDFTVNAMAYNPRCGLVDLFGGMKDLSDGVIRCVGTAKDRFNEDALRMFRAIRFSGQLGFDIAPDTRKAICSQYALLHNVSAERIQMELLKLLISDHPEQLREAYLTGLTSVFLPEFDPMMTTAQNNPHHRYTVGEHTLHSMMYVEPNPVLRLTILLHDIGKPAAKTTDKEGIDHFYHHNQTGCKLSLEILKRLKFDNKTIGIVTTLIRHHDIRFQDPKGKGRSHVRRVIHSVGENLFPYLLKVMEADVSAQSSFFQEEKLSILRETEETYQEILKEHNCLSLKDLQMNGKQLKALGIQEGKIIGTILNTLLSMVLETPELNQYSYLKELALKIYEQLR